MTPVTSEDDATDDRESPARAAESRANAGETTATEDDTPDGILSRAAIETINGRLDTIEGHLNQNTATVRARVIDAGDGTTLLRVPAEMIEEDHGDLVELSIHDVESRDK